MCIRDSYCEPPKEEDSDFINHPLFNLEGIPKEKTNDFIKEINDLLYSPKNLYAHHWKAGDIVIADNYTLLHGRESFTSGSARHLRRVQVLGSPALDNPHLVSTK